MPYRTFVCLVFLIGLIVPFAASAVSEKPLLRSTLSRAAITQPIAVIYPFEEDSSAGSAVHTVANMVSRSRSELELTIAAYELKDESLLAPTIERIAEDKVGLIVIIGVRDGKAASTLPARYPHIRFTLIDTDSHISLANAHIMQFDEAEGAFLIGALAALQSSQGKVHFSSKEDSPRTRALASAFAQGAKHIKPNIAVPHHLAQRNPSYNTVPEIIFVLDDDLLPTALRHTRQKGQWLITYDHDLRENIPDTVLTSLIKRHDLALHYALKSHRQNQWQTGNQMLGVAGGYLDYTLDKHNRDLLPLETISKMEELKDLLAQRIVEVSR